MKEQLIEQLKEILKRLRKPSVILSIISHIITILILLNVNVDVDAVTGIVTAITSIFILLGILSNPTSKNKGYGDDMLTCSKCNKKTMHTLVGNDLVCTKCGNIYTTDTENTNNSINN